MADEQPMSIVRRSSQVVQLVAARGALSIAEVAEQVEMPRASVYRLTEALAKARLVEIGADGKVRASLRCLRLSDATRAGLEEWSAAREVLDSLSDRTGQTTFLTVPDGDRALCIDWSRGRGISVLALRPGRTLPLYAGRGRAGDPRVPRRAARGLPGGWPRSRRSRRTPSRRRRASAPTPRPPAGEGTAGRTRTSRSASPPSASPS